MSEQNSQQQEKCACGCGCPLERNAVSVEIDGKEVLVNYFHYETFCARRTLGKPVSEKAKTFYDSLVSGHRGQGSTIID